MHTLERVRSAQALELAATSKLSDDDVRYDVVVRAKVKDLIKLGEMRWRYRVVDEGQSPRDEALNVLEEARSLIELHIHHVNVDKKAWSAELSEVCQGLALAGAWGPRQPRCPPRQEIPGQGVPLWQALAHLWGKAAPALA